MAAVFPWQAAVVVVYTALWNVGLCVFNTKCIIWQRCSHVNLVLVSNKKQDVSGASPPQTWFAWDLISSKHMLTGPIGVLGLAVFRGLQFCVFVFTIIYGNILYGPAGTAFFAYFTNWTFVLFGLTGMLGCILSSREWVQRRRPTLPCIETSKPPSKTHSWGLMQRFYVLLLMTTCSSSIMLTVFYWFADYVPAESIRFDNPVKHGASALLLLLDVALSRMPVVSYHLQVVIGYGTAYLVFLWCFYAGTGTWLYRALDWTRIMAVPYYCALPLLLALGFTIMFLVATLRELCINGCACVTRRHHTDEQVVTAQGADSAGGIWSKQHLKHDADGPYLELMSRGGPRLAITLTSVT